MGKRSGPRRGSMAFYPRKRAKRIYPALRSVKEAEGIPAFPAYKAGMTHVIALDTHKNSPSYGQKIAIPTTILECPPFRVYGIRAYSADEFGDLHAVGDVFHEKPIKELERKLKVPKKYSKEEAIRTLEPKIAEAKEIRLIVHTQPKKISLKKKPELFEMPLSMDVNEAWKFALESLGKEIDVSSVLKEGEFVDAIGITKGKGTQGPVKRFGIKVQRRKARGHRRFPGAIGAWTPNRVLFTVPMAGQTGYQRRTAWNKMVLKIGEDPKEVNPEGGIVNYGVLKGKYVLIWGSVPGPKKRLVILRKGLRKNQKRDLPTINEISLKAQQ